MTKSLHARSHRLSRPEEQLQFLESFFSADDSLVPFGEKIKESGLGSLTPDLTEILQVNLGYQCNQTCAHCHVDAGPDRKEQMTREMMKIVLGVIKRFSFKTLDITGGAPEMHPEFRWFVEEAKLSGVNEIIVRSNLTIIVSNPKYHDLPEFFSSNQVRICSSLPFYQASRTDRQRGDGVFEKSVRALKMLNDAGYGHSGSGLILDLVYNPSGAFLPANQNELEKEFKKELFEKHGIFFNRLLTITNVPISRFLEYLIQSGNTELYLEKLVNSFNPATVPGLMCRNTVSVDWRGFLYDCDFNQMLNLKIDVTKPHISNYDPDGFMNRTIVTRPHCYACTAGAGSSCQGSTI